MERVTLFGTGGVAPEVRTLADRDVALLRSAVRVISAYAIGHEPAEEDTQRLKHADADGRFALAGVHRLLSAARRLPVTSWKKEAFLQELKELKIPHEACIDLVDAVLGSRRSSIDDHIVAIQKYQPCHLAQMRWRVDVMISTTVLSRALQPTIVLQLYLGDGRRVTFEVSLAKFNALRCSVATVLKQLQQLEKGHLFKIQT